MSEENKISVPALPSVLLLLPIVLCFSTSSLPVLFTSSLVYGFGTCFSPHRLKYYGLLASLAFILVLGGLFMLTGEVNFTVVLLRWLINIWGVLFFFFHFGSSGALRMLVALRCPSKLLVAVWSGIRSFEVLLPTISKGLVLLRNEDISLYRSPVRFIGSLVLLLYNISDNSIREMEMSLLLKGVDSLSLMRETVKWNAAGIAVVLTQVAIASLMVIR